MRPALDAFKEIHPIALSEPHNGLLPASPPSRRTAESLAFSLPILKKLRAVHKELEREVPYLNDITSLVNVTATRGEQDELIIEELMEDWPEKETDMDDYINFIKTYAMPHHLYKNYLLSEDGKFTAIILESDVYVDVSDQPAEDSTDESDDLSETGEDLADFGEDSDEGVGNRQLNDEYRPITYRSSC